MITYGVVESSPLINGTTITLGSIQLSLPSVMEFPFLHHFPQTVEHDASRPIVEAADVPFSLAELEAVPGPAGPVANYVGESSLEAGPLDVIELKSEISSCDSQATTIGQDSPNSDMTHVRCENCCQQTELDFRKTTPGKNQRSSQLYIVLVLIDSD